MKAAALAVSLILAFFLLRRIYYLAHSFRRTVPVAPGAEPTVLVLAALRNEERRAHHLLDALERLAYPAERLFILLGDDASTDATGPMLDAWAESRPRAAVVHFPRQVGKAAVLNHLLEHARTALPQLPEFAAVYDAKHAPHPESLSLLAGACTAPRTGCSAGYLSPENFRDSLAARYGALDLWVNQHILFRAKAALGRPIPLRGGNCLFRVAALKDIGGFREGAYSEDTEAGLALSSRGWEIRYAPEASAGTLAPCNFREFWRQRVRWNYGLYAGSRAARSLEGWDTVTGYADRLAFLAALGFGGVMLLPLWVAALYALAVAASILLSVYRAGAVRDLPAIALSILIYAPADLAVSAYGAAARVLGRRPRWR